MNMSYTTNNKMPKLRANAARMVRMVRKGDLIQIDTIHFIDKNGHLERFNHILQEEIPKRGLCIYIKNDVLKFPSYYNTERLHMEINYKTPNEMLS